MKDNSNKKQITYFALATALICASFIVPYFKLKELIGIGVSFLLLVSGQLLMLYACTRTSILDRVRLLSSVRKFGENSDFVGIDDYNRCKIADIGDKIMHINHVYRELFYTYDKQKNEWNAHVDTKMKTKLSKRRVYLQFCKDMDNGLDEYLKQLIIVLFVKLLTGFVNEKQSNYSVVVVVLTAIVYVFYYFFIRGLKQNNSVYLYDYELKKIEGLLCDLDIPGTNKEWRKYKEEQYKRVNVDYYSGKDIEF